MKNNQVQDLDAVTAFYLMEGLPDMKKSFIVHLDSMAIIDEMPDEMLAKFTRALIHYQRTKELPDVDIALKLALIPFVNQFKRDEVKYEEVLQRNRVNGSKGGRKKEPSGFQSPPVAPDNENGNVSENDNESVSFKKWSKEIFFKEVDALSNKYSSEIIHAFREFWSELDGKGKMKFQLQETWETPKRLATWYSRSLNNQKSGFTPNQPVVATNGFKTQINNR